jgi:murein DD-endopeptidase MepM/ murein hydrolase activator NlpD
MLLMGADAVAQTARCLLADGFDYPVGKPDAAGYHKARGYTPNGHLGEDWNGNGGGDSDLGDPIYSTARGVVIISENVRVGWGNCIIVRHAYRDTDGSIKMVDSLYAHLNERKVNVGTIVERGQLVGTMGSNFGQYPVHLHFEMRKNLQIGMNRGKFARDNSNYYSPTAFIMAHRTASADFAKVDIPLKGFAPYGGDIDPSVAPKIKPSTSGYRIPVYKAGSVPPKSSAPGKGTSTTPGKPQPVTTPPAETGDFWQRLKSKMKSGQVVQPDQKK